jgi:hypothetical protein
MKFESRIDKLEKKLVGGDELEIRITHHFSSDEFNRLKADYEARKRKGLIRPDEPKQIFVDGRG